MYESAVKYALEISLDLAKECAKQVGEEKDDLMDFDDPTISSSEEVQKHVWLTIARHMIKNESSTADVMKLIKESGNVVNVDDLLPLFPEFTSIEALQGPLCDCLKEKSEKIQDVQKSIKEASELAESIKRDIETRQKTYRIVKMSDKCFRCDGNLFQKPFYAFNCWHYLHSECCEEVLLGLFKQ
uniref:Uncharacterized protein n=1 Tax=Panagrolaimus sp. ES5 TaxID=591445 RepID=A0AC34GFJ2_9BILA